LTDANAGRNAVAIADTHADTNTHADTSRGRLYAWLLEAEPALRLLE